MTTDPLDLINPVNLSPWTQDWQVYLINGQVYLIKHLENNPPPSLCPTLTDQSIQQVMTTDSLLFLSQELYSI